jgi:branched-chain amino acid transport system substrate-binding protein
MSSISIRTFQSAILSFSFLLIITSCSSEPVKKEPPPQADISVQKELALAKQEFAKNPAHALKRIELLIQKYPKTGTASEAAKVAGDYYLKSNRPEQAINAYAFILNNEFQEPFEGEIYTKVIRIYIEQKNNDQAKNILNQALRSGALTPNERAELLNYKIEFLKLEQDRMGQLETLAEMYNITQDPQAKMSYKIRATSIVDAMVRPQDLDSVLNNSRLMFVHSNIHFRLGSVAFEQSDFAKAREHFSKVISLNPDSDLAESSREFLKQLDARASVNTRTIGVILPLSGKHSDIGKSVLNSIQLGLGIYDRNSNLRLAVIDSEGKYLDARRAVEKLVIEDQVVAIIGSLQSKTATSIASKAQALGVPTIVLSQKSGITQIGDFIFRNALTSEMQVQYIVQTAVEKLGFTKFAILYPEDAYGAEYANLFWDAVQTAGGQIKAAQSYDPKETDFRAPIQKLVGTYYTDDRSYEFKAKFEEWKKKVPVQTARTEVPKDLLPPIVDFDAIFIPDNTKALGQIAAMLSFQDIKGVSLLGTNIWNTPGVIERAGSFSKNIIFVDSFLNEDQKFTNSDFYKRYFQSFGKSPSLFDLQAYDTALILRDAVSGVSSRSELQMKLAGLRSVKGALNTLDSQTSRDFSRPIVALTINDGKILTLEEAAAISKASPQDKPNSNGSNKKK